MGQLLTLATHCINDVKFYGAQKTPWILTDLVTLPNHKMSVDLDYDSITPMVTDKYTFERKVWHMYQYGGNSLGPGLSKRLTIHFNDEPPIKIFKTHVIKSKSEDVGSLDLVDKKWKLNWFNKISTHGFTCQITIYMYVYTIQCGTITEDITEEQYNNLIDTYEKNKFRLKQEADQAKIDSRLKQYQ